MYVSTRELLVCHVNICDQYHRVLVIEWQIFGCRRVCKEYNVTYLESLGVFQSIEYLRPIPCLLYTSDAADE